MLTATLFIRMRLKKHILQLPVKNITFASDIDRRKKHGDLLPDSVRCIICGPSNCGKTNVVINLLIHENGLKFQNLYIYSKSLHQDKYKLLSKILSGLQGIQFFTFSNNEDVTLPDKALPCSIFVFDDVVCDKQDNIRAYFCMGRHYDVDCFYLCQTYSRIPKQLIRDNANMIILFKQDECNLRHVYNDHVNTDMDYTDFQSICKQVWDSGPHNFLVISKDDNINNGRYRKSFDEYFCI